MVSRCVFSVDKPTKSKTSFNIYLLYCVLIFCVTVFVVFQYSYTDSPNEVSLILHREVLLSFLGGREYQPGNTTKSCLYIDIFSYFKLSIVWVSGEIR